MNNLFGRLHHASVGAHSSRRAHAMRSAVSGSGSLRDAAPAASRSQNRQQNRGHRSRRRHSSPKSAARPSARKRRRFAEPFPGRARQLRCARDEVAGIGDHRRRNRLLRRHREADRHRAGQPSPPGIRRQRSRENGSIGEDSRARERVQLARQCAGKTGVQHSGRGSDCRDNLHRQRHHRNERLRSSATGTTVTSDSETSAAASV